MSPLRFRIRELRLARGWSQEQLAAAAATSQSTISGLEAGQNKRVDLEVLDRIAKALGVPPLGLLVRSSTTLAIDGVEWQVEFDSPMWHGGDRTDQGVPEAADPVVVFTHGDQIRRFQSPELRALQGEFAKAGQKKLRGWFDRAKETREWKGKR